MFFILNHAADLRIVPRFPGSDILYKYNHLFELRFNSGGGVNLEIPNIPEGVFVSDMISLLYLRLWYEGYFSFYINLLYILFIEVNDLAINNSFKSSLCSK